MFKCTIFAVVVFAFIVSLYTAQGCHHGLAGRKKRNVNVADFEKLSSFFERCLRPTSNHFFPSLRSSVDFSIRDTKWFEDVNERNCVGRLDTTECWISALQFLLDTSSPLYLPTVRCICRYVGDCSLGTGQYHITSSSALPGNGGSSLLSTSPRSFPSGNDESYSKCLQRETRKYTSQYRSLSRLDVTSIRILLLQHFSFCKNDVLQRYYKFDTRTTFRLLFVDRLCPRIPERRSNFRQLLKEVTRPKSPVGMAASTCDGPGSDPYGPWTRCDKTCGSGLQFRKRTCNPSINSCTLPTTEQRSCNLGNCPIHHYGPWTTWTSCDKTCGSGLQFRKRTCNPEIHFCIQPTREQRPCNLGNCPIPHTTWGPCTATCGGGLQYSTLCREPGSSRCRSRKCNERQCPRLPLPTCTDRYRACTKAFCQRTLLAFCLKTCDRCPPLYMLQ